MKKIILLLTVAVILTGCGLNVQNKTVNTSFVEPVFGGSGAANYSIKVQASTDDAQEASGGTMDLTDSRIRLRSAQYIWGGLRFQDIAIPKNTTISTAYIYTDQLTTQYDDPNVDIYAEAVDDSTTFTSTASDISNRSKTTAKVTWNSTAIGSSYVKSPDIASVIQEIVNRSGWASGNDINIILDDLGGTWELATYDGVTSPRDSVILEVNFTADEQIGLAASGDDAWEDASLGGDTIITGNVGGAAGMVSTDYGGWRFLSVAIPNASTIDSAFISFYHPAEGVDDTSDCVWKGEVDAAIFTAGNDNTNISSRSFVVSTKTFTYTNFTNNLTNDTRYFSINITSIVQDIVNAAGWASGDNLAIVCDTTTTSDWNTQGYDTSAANSAKLSIMYTAPGGGAYQSGLKVIIVQ